MTNCKSLFVNCTKRSRQKSDFFFVGAFGFLSHQKTEKSFRQEMPGTAAEGGEKSTRSVLSRQGHRRKAERKAAKGGRKDLIVTVGVVVWACCFEVWRTSKLSKGFNCCGAKLPLRCAGSRFAEPRNSLKKVLIVAARSCSCSALFRGLQNLEISCERDVLGTFRVYEKNQKYTRGLRTSGLRGRFKALSKIILQSFPAAHVETGFAHKTAAKRL